MSTTTDAPARLPTDDGLLAARDAIGAAVKAAVHVRWVAWRIVRPITHEMEYERDPRDEVPTLEAIGRLCLFAHDMRSRLDEAREYVYEMDEMLEDLAVIRHEATGAGLYSDVDHA